MEAIIDIMEDDRCFTVGNHDRYFKSTMLKLDAEELLLHPNVEVSRKAATLIDAIGRLDTLKLGKALEKVEKEGTAFGGYRLAKIEFKEKNVVIYQVIRV